MVLASDTEYHCVAGKVDLNQYLIFCHSFEQRLGVVLKSDSGAVTDPARARNDYCLSNVVPQFVG